jgi:hypothetical protein
MIAFSTSIAEPEAYRRYSEPGIRAVAEADSEVYAFAGVASICRSYNLLLDAAAERDDLEALVIVHPHTEIVDPGLCAKVRAALSDPDVGVVGCAGASGVRSIAWWEGAVTAAPMLQRYPEYGGGELPAFAWADPGAPPAEVDAVAGFLLVLSPWVVRNVRFDEALRMNHGYDLDFCLQVRERGRRITVADLRVVRHESVELVKDLNLWVEAHMQVAEKWDTEPADWKQRARRAEAEREAARATAHANALAAEARIAVLERAVAEVTGSSSWRATEPLRRLNQLRQARRR